MRAFRAVPVVLLLVLIAGCGKKKLTTEESGVLSTLAYSMRNHASAFKIVRTTVEAKASSDSAALSTFYDKHGDTLNKFAYGVQNYADTGKDGLSKASIREIGNAANGAEAALSEWTAHLSKVKVKDGHSQEDWDKFSTDQTALLEKFATQLRDIHSKYSKAEE